MQEIVYLEKFISYLEELSEKLESDEDFQELLEDDVDRMADLFEVSKDLRDESQDSYYDVKSFVSEKVIENGDLDDETRPILVNEKGTRGIRCRNSASTTVHREKIADQLRRQLIKSFKGPLTDFINRFHMDEVDSVEEEIKDIISSASDEISDIVKEFTDNCVKKSGFKIGGLRDFEGKDEGLRFEGILSKPDTKEVNHTDSPSYVEVIELDESVEDESDPLDLMMEDN